MNKIENLLSQLIQLKGSDLHVTGSAQNYFRVKKEIILCEDGTIVSNNEIIDWIKSVDQKSRFLKDDFIDLLLSGEKDLDFSFSLEKARFRVHTYCIRGGFISISFRKIESKIPRIADLMLPDFYNNIANYQQGLVLITGATGSGKSTTIASLIDIINHRYGKKIVTLEEPVEYIFENKKSLVHQREVGTTVPSFKQGLKSILREDPDVVLLGEIRDAEEVMNALSISASGHLVFATLHTSGVVHTLGRILSLFDSNDTMKIKGLLQDNLKCIVNQSLWKTNQDSVVPLIEHLFVDSNTLRIFGDMPDHQVKSILEQVSNKDKTKMKFRWQSILELFQQKEIEYEEAVKLINIFDPEKLPNFEAQKSIRR
jgi:twitching motility protein PilT